MGIFLDVLTALFGVGAIMALLWIAPGMDIAIVEGIR